MADPNRKLDDWTDAARTGRGAGVPSANVEGTDDRRLLALHEALQEPPPAALTPDLVPIVMQRIARRATAASTTSGAQAGGVIARLRDVLSHITLGPVVAVGSLAAVLAVALWSAGDEGAAGGLSGAAAGVAVPSLVVIVAVAVGVGLAALWLRRR